MCCEFGVLEHKEGLFIHLTFALFLLLKENFVCFSSQSLGWYCFKNMWHTDLSQNILCKSACVGWEKPWWDDAKSMQILVLNDPMEKNAIIRVWMFLINNHKIVNEKGITAGLALHCCQCTVIWFSCWWGKLPLGRSGYSGNMETQKLTAALALLNYCSFTPLMNFSTSTVI